MIQERVNNTSMIFKIDDHFYKMTHDQMKEFGLFVLPAADCFGLLKRLIGKDKNKFLKILSELKIQ